MITVAPHIKQLPKLAAPKQLQLNTQPPLLRLCYNENTIGPPEAVVKVIKDYAANSHLYPDPGCQLLIEAIAEFTGKNSENIVVGNGSEGVMNYIFKALIDPEDEVLTSQGTFVGIYILSLAYNITCHSVPLNRDYAYDLNSIISNISPKTKVIYLVNPNNPTGTLINHQELHNFLQQVPDNILVVLDEAYYEYAIAIEPNYSDFPYHEYDNLLVLRTFSKAYGMASLRLGYGMGHSDIINALMRVKLTFEPGGLVQQAGIAALQEHVFLKNVSMKNVRGLTSLYQLFDSLNIHYIRSYANFIMLDLGTAEKASELVQKLAEKNVLISPLAPFGLPHCVRVTIGNDMEISLFTKHLKEIYHDLNDYITEVI